MSEIDLKPKSNLLQWTEEDVARILKQYDRKPEDLKADVAIIKEWLKTQPHLPLQPCDRKIVHFLLLNKFSFEKTKTKLEMSYTLKSLMPEFFSIPPTDPRIEISMNSYNYVPLPQLTADCNRIVVSKCQNSDTFNLCNFFNHFALLLELRTIYDIPNSDHYIFDFQNINMNFISKINLSEMAKGMGFWQKVYSVRIAVIHIYNLPKMAEGLCNLMLSMLNQKVQDRVYYRKNIEELWEFYPRDILPKEFGGTKPLEEFHREWIGLLRENVGYLEENQKARIVENLRPKKLENDEILGFHGNFRKLEID